MSLTSNYTVASLHGSAQKTATAASFYISHNDPLPKGSWSLPDSALPSQKKIPSPELFTNFSENSSGTSGPQLPSVAECAVHLELLQAFYHLRQNVLESQALDSVWQIGPDQTVHGTNRTYYVWSDETKAKRRLKWPLFNRIAALRFLDWLKLADSHLATTHADPGNIDSPPLDILMVWHAWLLNPQSFRDYCDLHGYANIRNIPFPWEGIHDKINNKNWKFTMPEDAQIQPDTLKTNDLFAYLCKADRSKLIHDMISDLLDTNLSERDIGRVIGRTEELTLTDDDFIHNCCSGMPLGDTLTAADEIAAAIERQCSFVDKMEKQLWISSPAVEATLHSAGERYAKFLKLMKLYPDITLSPTLDIDLVWHTHQCSASRYEADTRVLVGKFVDHNDKLGSKVLDPAMDKTARLWRVRFGEDYEICLCWDCQALRRAASKITEDQREKGLCSSDGANMDSVARYMGDYLTYYRYMEASRRQNRPIPRREK